MYCKLHSKLIKIKKYIQITCAFEIVCKYAYCNKSKTIILFKKLFKQIYYVLQKTLTLRN